MKSKPNRRMGAATKIQHFDCVAVEIIDPAEIAELQRKIRAAEKVTIDGYARLPKQKPRKKKPQKS